MIVNDLSMPSTTGEDSVTLLELRNVELHESITAKPNINAGYPRHGDETSPPICAICRRYIIDEVFIRVAEWYVHDCCACCAECGSTLTDELSCFVDENGSSGNTVPRLVCYADYVRLYTQRCASCCDLIVNGDLVVRIPAKSDKASVSQNGTSGRLFHADCFRCARCWTQIGTGELFMVGQGMLLCAQHYGTVMENRQTVLMPVQFANPSPLALSNISAPIYAVSSAPAMVNGSVTIGAPQNVTLTAVSQPNVLYEQPDAKPNSLVQELNADMVSPLGATMSHQTIPDGAMQHVTMNGFAHVAPDTQSTLVSSVPIVCNGDVTPNVPFVAAAQTTNGCNTPCSASLPLSVEPNGTQSSSERQPAKSRDSRKRKSDSKSRKSSCSADNTVPSNGNGNGNGNGNSNGVVLPFPIKERRGGRQRGVPSKRPRTVLTPYQREQFEKIFTVVHKPNRKLRDSLARQYNLTTRVVQVWFQNQRAKEKRISMGLPASASAAAKHMRMMNALALAGKLPALPTPSEADGDDADTDSECSSAASGTQADSNSSKRNDIDLAELNATLNLNLDLTSPASPSSSASN